METAPLTLSAKPPRDASHPTGGSPAPVQRSTAAAPPDGSGGLSGPSGAPFTALSPTPPGRTAAPASSGAPSTPPAVQRATTPAKPVHLRVLPAPTGTSLPLPVTPLAPPPSASRQPARPRPVAPVGPSAPAGTGTDGPAVQRLPFRSPLRSSATAALAARAAATVSSTLGHLTSRRDDADVPPPRYSPPTGPPPPYSPPGNGASPPPSGQVAAAAAPPPAYSRVPDGTFDPKDLTEFQLDELTHRMIGRITRLLRAELRMDRERIGRLRDDRR
ncbi:hypothetical protein [Streptomyces alboflavus]|uniref:Extensin n=1 Tax=Streptomyces alboflavus TaxID=67267 RepID=A0A1Z1WLQ5_9ACTN|nr:hypothetical protein [Streptomyces alboflavus]ARX87309.1 hypothetical protein SMD44_06790 [Streptomyces alboflavus]